MYSDRTKQARFFHGASMQQTAAVQAMHSCVVGGTCGWSSTVKSSSVDLAARVGSCEGGCNLQFGR